MGVEFAKLCGAYNLTELRVIPVETLIRCLQTLRAERHGLTFSPVVDGRLLIEGYDETVDHGGHLDIPYMIGSTENDIGSTPEIVASGQKSRLYEGCVHWSLKNAALSRKPAYVYYFTHKPLGDDSVAFHCAELWYVFGLLNRNWRPKDARDYTLESEMVHAWANFVKRGDPNNAEQPKWSVCAEPERFVRVFA
ncbi:MAG: carboxylesterase family protein [Oscillospiraceae bacterium]|jgi:para-nitrobenzyl esterase|nr:carboxylesterase family protein [Oscillospiraceae bacterium]